MRILTANYWWTITLRGLIAVLFGIATLAWPEIAIQTMVVLFGTFALLDGIVNLSLAVRTSKVYGRWWELSVQGLVGVGVGFMSFVWPAVTAVALIYIVAFWAVAVGLLEMAASIRLGDGVGGRWLLSTSGLWSALFGIFLFVCPIAALHGLIWLLGAIAIVSGSVLVFFGLKLRRIGFELQQDSFA
jgi:uncharacterized membrane protein HdeD (DUF308 family)